MNMKTRNLILLFACLLILPATSNAQVGNLLRNKMGKVVNAGTKTLNKEVDNQIDTAVNKEADKAREKGAARTEANKANNNQPTQTGGSTDQSGSGGNGGSSGAGFSGLFGNKIDLKYKEDYSFTSRIYMIMEMYDKKDVTKMDYFMFYSSSTPSVGIETKSIDTKEEGAVPVTATMVMDGENKCFLVLTDVNGMKMGMISAIPDENTAGTQADGKKKKDNPPNFTKTGNTKVIAGYKCDEYTYKDIDDNSTGKVWFTKDSKLKIDKKGWQNSNMAAYYGNPDFNEGIILASESYDDKGKLTAKSETKEINENFPHAITVKGYTLRQMNMGQGK
jgi:hypothetical protein